MRIQRVGAIRLSRIAQRSHEIEAQQANAIMRTRAMKVICHIFYHHH